VRVRGKAGFVAAGYLGAFLIASVAVAVQVAWTSGPDLQMYSGMYAFGDSLLFLAVFGVFALMPTGAALFFLRSHLSFWRALSALALAIATTGMAALFIYVGARDPHASAGLQYWSTYAILRILISPLLAAAFLLALLLAPTRRLRAALLLTTLAETAVSVSVAAMWVHDLHPR
jgi:hypothetical protein